ncbi:hypothetical protein [Adhaeribacter swui]|uniref:hypothetical protein n=1 Tax=Adhaeribacter swui TaxID=2086471 RepID=UPI001E50DB55|nr:hypothetical protein [Adhaeribacter swui]
MKKLFYASVLGFILFEIANIYFIMPMPGSQQMNSIDLAYQLYSWRWFIRGLFLAGMLVGFRKTWLTYRYFTIFALVVVAGIAYLANFNMAADAMFLPTTHLTMVPATAN